MYNIHTGLITLDSNTVSKPWLWDHPFSRESSHSSMYTSRYDLFVEWSKPVACKCNNLLFFPCISINWQKFLILNIIRYNPPHFLRCLSNTFPSFFMRKNICTLVDYLSVTMTTTPSSIIYIQIYIWYNCTVVV